MHKNKKPGRRQIMYRYYRGVKERGEVSEERSTQR